MSIYNKAGIELSEANSITGEDLITAWDTSGGVVFTNDYENYVTTDYCAVTLSATMQGFAIYNGVIFQLMANSSGTVTNKMATIRASTSEIINGDIFITSDHGDSASFSKEFYLPSDEYPLLYVSADTHPGKVYVNRVTRSASQLIRTLVFPLEKTGYYSAAALDADNSILYMIGYSEENYQTDDGGNNKTVISKWDLSTLTNNGDGTYTPEFISSYEREFIYVMQGQEYRNGMLWIASGGSNYRGQIYALDPETGEILHTVDTATTTEIEGVAFISSTEMVYGLQGGAYKKVSFGVVT